MRLCQDVITKRDLEIGRWRGRTIPETVEMNEAEGDVVTTRIGESF